MLTALVGQQLLGQSLWRPATAATPHTPNGSLFGPAATYATGQATGTTARRLPTAALDLAAIYNVQHPQSVPSSAQSPRAARREQAALERVAELVAHGGYTDAEQLLTEILRRNPTSATAIHARGVIAFEQREYEAAARQFDHAHALAPKRGYDEDAQVARHLLNEDDDELVNLSRRLLGSEDTRATGQQLLAGVTQRNPLHTEGRLLLADELLQQRDAVGALAQYRMAILTADDAQLHRIEGRLAGLVKLAPQGAYVRRLLGEAQLALGRNQAALHTLELATELSGDDIRYRVQEVPAHVAVGRDRLAHGDVAGALGAFEQARSIDPSSPAVRLALAEGYLARGEANLYGGAVEAAINDFLSAKSRIYGDGDPDLRTRLARHAYAAGVRLDAMHQRDGAEVGAEITAVGLAHDLEPENAVYRLRYAALKNRVGDEFFAEARYEDAAAAYRRAHDLDPRNGDYRADAANAFALHAAEALAAHDHDEALEAYETSYDLVADATVRIEMAGAYNERGLLRLGDGDVVGALRDFQQALYYDAENPDYQDNYNQAAAA